MTSRSTAYAGLVFATVAWGGLFHSGKAALALLDPFWFTALRYAGASALMLLLLLVFEGIQLERIRNCKARLFLFGLLGYGMFGLLVFVGLQHTVASHGALIMATMPITSLFIKWLLDGQRPTWLECAASLCALLGVSLVCGAWQSQSDTSVSTLLGDLTIYIGTLGWIVYTRQQRTMPHLSVLEYTAYSSVLAWPALLLAALSSTAFGLTTMPSWPTVLRVAPDLAYVVAIGTVAAALAYNMGVRRLGAGQGILFINLVPVSAMVIAVFRHQSPSVHEWAGAGIVVAALAVLAWQTSTNPNPSSSSSVRAPGARQTA